MEARKHDRTRVLFIISVTISLALLGWWAAINVAMLSAITPNFPSREERHLNSQVSAPSVSYRPIHYLFFNGNDSYGLIRGNHNLNVSHFSIAFWAKGDGPSHYNFDRPVEMLTWLKNSSGVTVPHGWAFDAGNQTKLGIDRLRFTVGSSLGNLFITRPAILSRISWTYVVGTFDGRTLKIYQNGDLVGTSPFRGPYSHPSAVLPIRLGMGFLPHHYWTGDLSDIRIYGRPLSSLEINSSLHGRNFSNGLIGHWALSEGTGSSIIDSSGNNNNGVIHNGIWK